LADKLIKFSMLWVKGQGYEATTMEISPSPRSLIDFLF